MGTPPYLLTNRELRRKLRTLEFERRVWEPMHHVEEWDRRRRAFRDWMLIIAAFLAAIAAGVTAYNSISQTQRLRPLDSSPSQLPQDSETSAPAPAADRH